MEIFYQSFSNWTIKLTLDAFDDGRRYVNNIESETWGT